MRSSWFLGCRRCADRRGKGFSSNKIPRAARRGGDFLGNKGGRRDAGSGEAIRELFKCTVCCVRCRSRALLRCSSASNLARPSAMRSSEVSSPGGSASRARGGCALCWDDPNVKGKGSDSFVACSRRWRCQRRADVRRHHPFCATLWCGVFRTRPNVSAGAWNSCRR